MVESTRVTGSERAETTSGKRGARRTVVGTVVSDKMTKTIAVREDRMVRHAKYGKYRKRATVYKAHDEERTAKEGDLVEIAFTRRLSKTKHWTLVQVIRRGRGRVVSGEEDRERAAAPAPRPAGGRGPGAPGPVTEGAEGAPGASGSPAPAAPVSGGEPGEGSSS
jgi:small subunit ribosomal protein S17